MTTLTRAILAAAALAVVVKRRVGQTVKLAGGCVALDLLVEAAGLVFLEPGAQPVELARRERGDGLLDVFDSGHTVNVAAWKQRR